MGFSGLNWVASQKCDRAQQAATNFLLFSVDLVMAQVDRTMQILSGGYLNSIRAIG
ncbi:MULTISPECIES: hypothetical protein [unclassified Microcoleus]|uniref:hypothetical protein n=1 Tax=unclassified Microcoleus TaxID=2642155 RepID=UPI002FD031D6